MTVLRRTFAFDTSAAAAEELSPRWLQSTMNATSQQNSSSDNSNPYNNSAFMMFLTVIVVLVVLCYLICLYHMIQMWCCKREREEPPRSVVVSGRVFNLTPGQRRAVLEAIFSENSKAVTETDVLAERKEKRRRRRNKSSDKLDGDIPMDVEVPTIKSVNTFVTSEGGSDHDVEEGVVVMSHEPNVPALPDDYDHHGESQGRLEMKRPTSGDWNVVQSTNGQFIIQADPSPRPDQSSLQPDVLPSPTVAPMVISDDMNEASNTTGTKPSAEAMMGDAVGACRQLPFTIRQVDDQEVPSPIFRRLPIDLAVPDLREGGAIPLPVASSTNHVDQECNVEESKEEEKTEEEDVRFKNSSRALLSDPITFTRVESICSAYTSEFDDETEENVCPICINSYHEGDILIASKHCSHLFHKDCILEWLEKHETCPVCRVDMVTDSEMNQAATSIVGRTRMYVAVESITRSPRHAATNNAGPHRHVLPAHRHIVAAPRTPPSSPPHRYPRTMGYASR